MRETIERRMRRTPRQDRSSERVDRILAAAEKLFAKNGFDATTTNEIARKAGTSIGSLYRFFPDKQSILEALVSRYFKTIFSDLAGLIDRKTMSLPLRDLVETLVDGYIEQFERYALQRAVLEQTRLTPDLWLLYEELNQSTILAIADNLEPLLPHLSSRRRQAIAHTCWYATDALERAMKFSSPGFARDVEKETKLMLIAYLNPYFQPKEHRI